MRSFLLSVILFLLVSCATQKTPIVNDPTKEIKKEKVDLVNIKFSEAIEELTKNIRDNGKKIGIVATRHGIEYQDEQNKTCKANVIIQIAIKEQDSKDSTMKEIDALVKNEFAKLAKGHSFWNEDKKVVEASVEYNVVLIVMKNKRNTNENRIEANST